MDDVISIMTSTYDKGFRAGRRHGFLLGIIATEVTRATMLSYLRRNKLAKKAKNQP